jgi:membrane dipeptidase
MMGRFEFARRRFLQTAMLGAATFGGRRASGAPLAATGNDKIEKARQAALAVLSPTDAELERGLRLHAESIVFDAYGFAPRSAVDADAIVSAMEAGASDAELRDLREELMMVGQAQSAVERAEFFAAFHAAGVTCIFQNAGEEGNDPLRLLKRLARFTFTCDTLRPELTKAVGPDDVRMTKRNKSVCLAFTTNGVPLPQNWETVRDELQLIRVFRQLGVHMMHVTYNRRNPLGDGAGEANDGGLSDFGRAAVAEMNRLGVIVDVAHSGWRTSLEAAKASTKPMVASHTACAALHKHYRGKPDEVIRAICDTGGLIGICCIPQFLGGKADLGAFLDHLDYAIRKFGAEHVAIGTDVAYVSRNEATERAKIDAAATKRGKSSTGPRWEALWPPHEFRPPSGAGESLAWTNWPLFTVGLVQRGHSDDVIRRVLGENMLRVWAQQKR